MNYMINPGARGAAQRALNEIKERYQTRKAFTVAITEYKPKHSDEQRGYYWASLTEFGKSLGMNAKDSEKYIHNELKCRLFGVERVVHIGDSLIQVPKGSTSKLNKQMYAELINELIIMAGEYGYVVPPPEQHTGEAHA